MNDKDKIITAAMQDAARLELAMAVPEVTLIPLLTDIARRDADEVLVIINSAERPGGEHDMDESLLAIVRRDVLAASLGNTVPVLKVRKLGHVPFVVIDKHGTTVIMVDVASRQVNTRGGSA